MISKKARMIFDEVYGAAHAHELCLVECVDRKTGKKVNVLCATSTEGGVVRMQPLRLAYSAATPTTKLFPRGWMPRR